MGLSQRRLEFTKNLCTRESRPVVGPRSDSAVAQSLVWIIGEYADKIESPMELLQLFVDSFQDEPTGVQMQVRVRLGQAFWFFAHASKKNERRDVQATGQSPSGLPLFPAWPCWGSLCS